MAVGDKVVGVPLSKTEVENVCECIDLKIKSHERAARASTGAISGAHTAAATVLQTLMGKFRNHSLEV